MLKKKKRFWQIPNILMNKLKIQIGGKKGRGKSYAVNAF